MTSESPLLLTLDLSGTFAFALNGGLTAVQGARLDIVGVVTLGMITAVGGGILRDVLLGSFPPASLADWRYLVVAAAGGLLAFLAARRLEKLAPSITVLDAAGLSLFAVTGASKALGFGVGAGEAIILGVITAAGGGTIRDVLLSKVPTVLRSDLYVIPALVAAIAVVVAYRTHLYSAPVAVGAAAVCFTIRMAGVLFGWNAPRSPAAIARGSACGQADSATAPPR